MRDNLRGGRQLLSPLPNTKDVLDFLKLFTFESENNQTFKTLNKELEQKFVIDLSKEEHQHATKVLRIKNEEVLRIFDIEKQLSAFGKFIHNEKSSQVNIFSLEKTIPPSHKILIGLPDPKTAEFCVETLTAINAQSIEFYFAERSQNKGIDHLKLLTKLYKKRDSAIKQSFASYAPQITISNSFEKSLKTNNNQNTKILALVSPNDEKILITKDIKAKKIKDLISNNSYSYAIIIGPEGGFSSQELNILIDQEIIFLTLGENVLRVETAASVALATLNSII